MDVDVRLVDHVITALVSVIEEAMTPLTTKESVVETSTGPFLPEQEHSAAARTTHPKASLAARAGRKAELEHRAEVALRVTVTSLIFHAPSPGTEMGSLANGSQRPYSNG
jgi:hypothetical protein